MDDLVPLRCDSTDDPSLHEPLIALTSPARNDAGWSLFGDPSAESLTKDAPAEPATKEGSIDEKGGFPDRGMLENARAALIAELREPVSSFRSYSSDAFPKLTVLCLPRPCSTSAPPRAHG